MKNHLTTGELGLTFWVKIQPDSGSYVSCKRVMVDRAEVGTEWQAAYNLYCAPHASSIPTDRFGQQLYDSIGGEPGLVWYKNFANADGSSAPGHWDGSSDSAYADSVDLTSWSGHSWGVTNLHFFLAPGCTNFSRASLDTGDLDAEWVIFDTCWFLDGLKADLQADLLSSNPNARSAHMFLGFATHGENPDDWVMTYWKDADNGAYFANSLRYMSVKAAWFDYCEAKQYRGCKARAFHVMGYDDESVSGPGPIALLRDPIPSDDWRIDSYLKTSPPDPP
jgi:hypothetical protein